MKVGILGGGQLARMLAQAGASLDISCIFLCPAPDACAGPFAEQLRAGFEDAQALEELASRVEVVTCEFENVPAKSLRHLESLTAVRPGAISLAISQDRLLEKDRLRRLGLTTTKYASVSCMKDLWEAVEQVGLPALLKTRRLGYDGKGQAVLRSLDDLVPAWEQLEGAPCILEAMVPFDRELSIIGVRAANGEKTFYPLSENLHRAGLLRLSLSRDQDPQQGAAETMLARLLDDLEHVGVLTLELFESRGALLANEMAARVHNSGHWTIEATPCSQFENHMRAVTGLPLGNTSLSKQAAMVNIVGSLNDKMREMLAARGFLHDYGKSPRKGRKLGHVTLLAEQGQVKDLAEATAASLELVGESSLAAQVRKGELRSGPQDTLNLAHTVSDTQ